MNEELYLELKNYLESNNVLKDNFYDGYANGSINSDELEEQYLLLKKFETKITNLRDTFVNRVADPFDSKFPVEKTLSETELKEYKEDQIVLNKFITQLGLPKNDIPDEKLSDGQKFVRDSFRNYNKVTYYIYFQTGINGFFNTILNNIQEHLFRIERLMGNQKNNSDKSITNYLLKTDEHAIYRDGHLIIRDQRILYALICYTFLDKKEPDSNPSKLKSKIKEIAPKVIFKNSFIDTPSFISSIKTYQYNALSYYKNEENKYKAHFEKAIDEFKKFILNF